MTNVEVVKSLIGLLLLVAVVARSAFEAYERYVRRDHPGAWAISHSSEVKSGLNIFAAVFGVVFIFSPQFRAMSMIWKVVLVTAALIVARIWVVWAERDEELSGQTGQQPRSPLLPSRASARELNNSLLVALALVFFIIKPFAVAAFWIPSTSMVGTLLVSDRVVVNRFAYRFMSPRRGDIVVFKPPPTADKEGKEFIKRLIGLPGDRIRITNGQLYVNGQAVSEPYIRERPNRNFPRVSFGPGERIFTQYDSVTGLPVQLTIRDGDVIVPEGHYFMLGDNRNQSHDGREWGFVPEGNIIGRAMFIFWPPGRVRVLYAPDVTYGPGRNGEPVLGGSY